MESEILAQKSSFTSAVKAKESIDNENENENTNHMQMSPQKEQEPVPEKDQFPADSPLAAAPSPPEQVDATVEDPMEEEEEDQAIAEDKLDDAALVDLTEDLAVDDDSVDAVAPLCEESDVSMVDVPPQQPKFVQDAKVPTTEPVVKAARTSRSPLRLVQSGVQSAIKIFSKSPAKVTWSASKKKSPEYLLENKPVGNMAKHEGGDEYGPMSTENQDLDKDSDSEPEEAPQANEVGKAGVRLLNTPAFGGSLSSGASGMKASTSTLSSIVKAKNEARKAKLAEIRGKVSLFW
jgi:hypothetical protein